MSHSYDNSVGTTLGVALVLSGGGMQASGTVSFTFTSGAGGEVTGLIDRRSYNQVNYRKLMESCYLQAWWKPYATTNILYPIYYIAGQPNWEPNCGTYSSGYMYKTAGTNKTFSTGINLGPIGVSAHTDWKTDNKLKWNFSSSTRLCGSTANGWVSSPQAEAHQP